MVKIIADSTCDLSDATLKKYDIDMLPLYIHMGENEYKDRLEVTVEDIFKWSDQYNTTPKTSAPSIEDAQNAIIPYMEKNADIIMQIRSVPDYDHYHETTGLQRRRSDSNFPH